MHKMTLLALETATDPGSVALWRDGDVDTRHCPDGHSNSATLLPLAGSLLNEHGLGYADLDGIAFGMGPGSFTGLRVACGVAQGLAVARDLPVLGIVTLEAMALASGAPRVLVLLDARMGEVYCAYYENGLLLGQISVCPPAAVPLPTSAGWLVCGNGLAAYPVLHELLAPYAVAWRPAIMPDAGSVARLAAPRLQAGEGLDPADAAPLYVRDKVAKTVAERLASGGRA